MNSREIDKVIKDTHTNLIDTESLVPTTSNGINNNNPNHPRNWSDTRRFDYTRKWILEFSRMTIWRDNPKAGPLFKDQKDLVEKLSKFPEEFLQDCVRYKIRAEDIDPWLKLTPEERYQKRINDLRKFDLNAYFEPTGSISDDEILDWFRDKIGNRTYEQLKKETTEFMKAFMEYIQKQANELPATFITSEYWYIPSITHL